MFRPIVAVLALSLLGASAYAAEPAKETPKPSFDCATAKSKVRLLICSSTDLSTLDLQEAQMLHRAQRKAVQPEAVNAQEDVWRGYRDACANVACLARVYRSRIRELHEWAD